METSGGRSAAAEAPEVRSASPLGRNTSAAHGGGGESLAALSKSPSGSRLSVVTQGANGLRGRSASLQIPKKTKPLQTQGLLSSSSRSPPNSPPHQSNENEIRRSLFPRHLRFSVVTEVNMPSGWGPSDTEMAIETFFDGLAELKESDFSVPSGSGASKAAIPFQKSPRQGKAGNRKVDATVTQLVGAIDPLLKLNGWSSIFRARLGIRGSLLTGQSLDTLAEMVNYVAARGASDLLSDATMKRILSLKEFLECWKLDVDSAVVGVEVHSSLVSEYVFPPIVEAEEVGALTNSVGPLDESNGEVSVTGGAASIGASVSATSAAITSVLSGQKNLDLFQLREKIVQISESPSVEVAFAQIKELARRFRSEDMGALRKGDLVVALVPAEAGGGSAPIYCRFIRHEDDRQMVVLSMGSGSGTTTIRATQCRPLGERSRKLIERGQIGEVVVDHFSTLQERLAAYARQHALSLVIAELESDPTLRGSSVSARARRALESGHGLTVFDLALLKRLDVALLGTCVSPRTTDSSVAGKLADIFASYTENLTARQFSGKDRDRNIGRLLGLGQTLPRLVEEELNALRERGKASLRLVEEQCEAVLSGARKQVMSSEWLTHVREAVNALLEARGFDANACPHDYISVRPTSISAVRSNFKILQALLRNESGDNDVVLLAQALRAKIYPVCERFIDEAIHVCQSRLECVLRPDEDALEQLQEAVRQREKNGAPFDKRVCGVLEDVVYLREMRRLEDHPGEKNPHIVPVSGLVISSIVRKEKEMQTVLEVWDQ